MSPERAATILNTIAARTKEGIIPWTSTADEDAYDASYENYTIRVVRERGEYENDVVYYVELLNETGSAITAIRPNAVEGIIENAWVFTGDLFSNARDKALGVDEIVDKLMSDLGGPVPPAPKKRAADSLDEEEIPF